MRSYSLAEKIAHAITHGAGRITRNLHDEARADRLITCIEEGIATSPAFTEGEAGQLPDPNVLFARSARAGQVWKEVIRIHNACSMELDHPPPDDRP